MNSTNNVASLCQIHSLSNTKLLSAEDDESIHVLCYTHRRITVLDHVGEDCYEVKHWGRNVEEETDEVFKREFLGMLKKLSEEDEVLR